MKTVEVTQYILPNGRTRTQYARVDEEHYKKSKGMVFSAEVIRTGTIVVYGRYEDQKEEEEYIEFASLTDENNSPAHCLNRVIDVVYERGRHAEDLHD